MEGSSNLVMLVMISGLVFFFPEKDKVFSLCPSRLLLIIAER